MTAGTFTVMRDSAERVSGGDATVPGALRLREVAALLSLSERKVEYLVASGEIDSFKIGKSRRVRPAAVEAFLDAQEQQHRGVA